MSKHTIDINADVGEGIQNESLLLPYISSCNVACGGHAGNQNSIEQVVNIAIQHGVKIGAHPSFPDRKHFGRQPMSISDSELTASLQWQIQNVITILQSKQRKLHHIKPHGALYNLAAVDKHMAQLICNVVKHVSKTIKLYVPFNSVIAKVAAKNDIPIVYEAFADRNYNDNLTLVSRTQKQALITQPKAVFEHVYNMVVNQQVVTVTGIKKDIKLQTICVHGDTPNAVQLLHNLIKQLKQHNIAIV